MRLKSNCDQSGSVTDVNNVFQRRPEAKILRDRERARQHRDKMKASDIVQSNDKLSESADSPSRGSKTLSSSQMNTRLSIKRSQVCSTQGNMDYGDNNDGSIAVEGASGGETTTGTQPELEQIFVDRGYVKDYIDTITDSSVRKRLKNKKRNLTFLRVSRDQKSKMLLCESDDLVLECGESRIVGNGSAYCGYWYVKQQNKKMLPEERTRFERMQSAQSLTPDELCVVYRYAKGYLRSLRERIIEIVT